MIREMLVNEGPLWDIASYEVPDRDDASYTYNTSKKPSIGHVKTYPKMHRGRHADKETAYKSVATELMKNTADNWHIIVTSDTRNSHEMLKSNAFKTWVASRNIPNDARIIVVSGSPYSYDYETPQWQIVHDIIGHSMYNNYIRFMPRWLKSREHIESILHETLPERSKLGDVGDKGPDVLAAIMLKTFNRKKAKAELMSSMKNNPDRFDISKKNLDIDATSDEIIAEFEEIEKGWIDSFPPGVPTLVSPFGSGDP